MDDEVVVTEPEAPSQVPPEAFDRVKKERDDAKATNTELAEAGANAILIDKIHEYWESKPASERPENPRQSAKFLAQQLPAGVEDIPAAIEAFTAEMSSLQPQTVADAPPPPMAGDPEGPGPQPGATGESLETGPFPMNGKEFKAYFAEHGARAANVAIANGMFIPSDENVSAQNTIDSV